MENEWQITFSGKDRKLASKGILRPGCHCLFPAIVFYFMSIKWDLPVNNNILDCKCLVKKNKKHICIHFKLKIEVVHNGLRHRSDQFNRIVHEKLKDDHATQTLSAYLGYKTASIERSSLSIGLYIWHSSKKHAQRARISGLLRFKKQRIDKYFGIFWALCLPRSLMALSITE